MEVTRSLQGIASTLLFLVFTQLGNPSTSSERKDHFSTFNAKGLGRAEEAENEISLMEDIFPMILSRTGSLTQILINAMLVKAHHH